MPNAPVGHHILIDLFDCACDPEHLERLIHGEQLWADLESDCRTLGRIQHQFDPSGYTIVTALAESHMSIHTWPQTRFVSIDFYTCTGQFPHHLTERVIKFFQPGRIHQQDIERGNKSASKPVE